MESSGRRIPPLNTVVAFEAAVRAMSFTAAAKELHLSQGAVSRQIQRLEERLGTPLFERRNKKIVLTRAGEIFYAAIGESLAAVRRAVYEIERLNTTRVSLSASMAMASFWVMPALLLLRERQPSISEVSLLAEDRAADPLRDDVDLAILYGDGNWPGLTAHRLFDEKVFPVCSKAYLERHPIRTPADLADATLIDVMRTSSVCGTWSRWLERAGITRAERTPPALTVSSFELAYRAAEAGQGVALTWNYGCDEVFQRFGLVRPVSDYVETGLGEYLVLDSAKPQSDTLRTVLDTLLEYARTDGGPIF